MTSRADTGDRLDRTVGLVVSGVVLAARSAAGFGLLLLVGVLGHVHGTQRWALAAGGALLPVLSDLEDRALAGLKRRRIRRALARGRVPSALRVLEGHHPGLRSSWTHGTARVQAGTIAFQPWFLSRNRSLATLGVLTVDAAHPEHRGPGEGPWRIVADCDVVTLETAGARVRWALPVEAREDVLARLGVPTTGPVETPRGDDGPP